MDRAMDLNGQALNVLLDFAQENQHWAHGNCVMKVNVLGHSMLSRFEQKIVLRPKDHHRMKEYSMYRLKIIIPILKS